MILIDYYEESNIKKKRRGELLEQCNTYFHSIGLNKATMSDIALFLNIERRTLYAYYNNITDLIVDAHLYRSEIFIEKLKQMSCELEEVLLNKSTREQLQGFFEFVKNGIIGVNKEYPEFLDFETYFKHLDPNSDTKKRYGFITKQFGRREDILKGIINQGMEVGAIKELGLDAHLISSILDQTYRAYLNKILLRQDDTGRYKLSNLDAFLNLLIEGICV